MNNLFRKITAPFRFLFSNPGAGVLLLLCVAVSLIIANSSHAHAFQQLLDMPFGFRSGAVDLEYSVSAWINDGLMSVFFLLVGLEIKREMKTGELSTPQRAVLPVCAAIGGVLIPAGIFRLMNNGLPTEAGWAIPMATDIAFALAVISMLGKKVPASLKIFLAALAIADDLLAILVITFFYSGALQWEYLVYAGTATIFLLLCNRLRITSAWVYLLTGMLIWYWIHHSGVHATIAGVITAMTIPAFRKKRDGGKSLLERLEHALSRPVNLLIMPLFALANTNITFEPGMAESFTSPLGVGIILGLVAGKPAGILAFSWISIRSGIAAMPARAGWRHLLGVGMLAGIGFTMSLFIAVLSFGSQQELLTGSKSAILLASTLSACAGVLFLSLVHKNDNKRLTSG